MRLIDIMAHEGRPFSNLNSVQGIFFIDNCLSYAFTEEPSKQKKAIILDKPFPFDDCWFEGKFFGGPPSKRGLFHFSLRYTKGQLSIWRLGPFNFFGMKGYLESTKSVSIIPQFLTFNGQPTKVPLTYNKEDEHLLLHDTASYMCVAVRMALELLECKNVSLEKDVESNRQIRKTRKRNGIVVPAQVIRVRNPTKKRINHHQPTNFTTDGPLRIFRGHYKTYTEQAPLFGKITGKFWWPAHTRGSLEYGEVHSRKYSIK